MAIQSQVRFKINCMKSKIATALVLRLDEVWDLKYIAFDRVKVLVSDFNETEIPGCQLIDLSETVTHEASRILRRWQIALEVVMKQTENRYVDQQELWDLCYSIERKLWSVPNLGIPGVVQLTHLGTTTDLHLIQPYYTARILVEVSFYDNLVRDC